MKKIDKFNKPNLKTLTTAAMKEMEKVAEKYGLAVKKGGGTFDADNFTMKIEFSIIGEDGVIKTKEAKAFEECADWWGLEPRDLYKTFKSPRDGKIFKIIGASPRSPKFPIIVQDMKTGGQFKFTEKAVKLALYGEA